MWLTPPPPPGSSCCVSPWSVIYTKCFGACIFLLPLPSPASPLPSYLLFDGVSLTGKREKKNWVYHGVDLTLYEFCVPDMGKRLYFNPLQPMKRCFYIHFCLVLAWVLEVFILFNAWLLDSRLYAENTWTKGRVQFTLSWKSCKTCF